MCVHVYLCARARAASRRWRISRFASTFAIVQCTDLHLVSTSYFDVCVFHPDVWPCVKCLRRRVVQRTAASEGRWLILKNASAPISDRRLWACNRWTSRLKPPECTKSAASPGASSASPWWCRSKSRGARRGALGDAFWAGWSCAPGATLPTRADRNTYATTCVSVMYVIYYSSRT